MAPLAAGELLAERPTSVFFLAGEWSDAGTITLVGGSLLPGTTLLDLQTDQPSDVCGFGGPSAIRIDRGTSGYAFDTVALIRTNATVAGKWQIRIADTAADLTNDPAWISEEMDLWPSPNLHTWDATHAYRILPRTFTERFVQVVVAPYVAGDFFIGRLLIGQRCTGYRNYTTGMTAGFADASRRKLAEGGQTLIGAVPITPRFRFGIEGMEEEQALELDDFLRRNASHPVLCVLRPDDAHRRQRWMVYGLVADMAVTHIGYRLWSTQIEIEGMR